MTATVQDMADYLNTYYPSSEAGALRMLENAFPDANPADRAEVAKQHRAKEGLGPVG